MSIFGKKNCKQLRKSTLRVESLEDRMLLAVSAGEVPFDAADAAAAAPEFTGASSITLTDTSAASLRAAVKNIENGGTITYASNLAGQTVDVNDGYGTIVIKKSLNIVANGVIFTNSVTNGKGQIFRIDNPTFSPAVSNVSFTGAAFVNGTASGYDAEADGIYNCGSAIYFMSNVANPTQIKVSITIDSCNFKDNSADMYAGAVYAYGANLTITNTTFKDNSSFLAGGALAAICCNVTIDGCSFTGNTVEENGGAIYFVGRNDANSGGNLLYQISNTTFTGNAAKNIEDGMSIAAQRERQEGGNEYTHTGARGGAIYASWIRVNDDLKMNNCTFTENVATASGEDCLGEHGCGCLVAKGGALFISDTHLTAESCTFTGNGAYNALNSHGGAIYVTGDGKYETKPSLGNATRLYSCVLEDNYVGSLVNPWDGRGEDYAAHGMEATGGAIHSYGIVIIANSALINNTIYGSSLTTSGALKGSAIYANTSVAGNSTTNFIYCYLSTIAGNKCITTNANEGISEVSAGIWDWGKADYNGCVILDNTAEITSTGTVYDYNFYSLAIKANQSTHSVFKSCAINTSTMNYYEGINLFGGNIEVTDVNSFFYNAEAGQYSLAYDSSAIDAYNMSYKRDDLVVFQKDVRGGSYKRLVNNIYDIGAYEIQSSTPEPTFTVTVTGWEGKYDGNAHSISVSGLKAGDIVLYSTDGENYGTANPGYTAVGTYTTYVCVSRTGYQDFYGSANVVIQEAGGGELAAPAIKTGAKGVYVAYGCNRHQITWNAVSGAQSYELSYSADGKTWKTVSATGTSAVVTGLTYGTDVKYKVRAVAGSKTSDWSAVKTFNVCPMDINGDGDIAGADRSLLSSAWLSSEGDDEFIAACDINGDGDVAGADRNFLSSNWLAEAGDEDLVYPKAKAADAAVAEFVSEFDIDLEVF